MRDKAFKKYAKCVPGLKRAVSKIRKELDINLENASEATVDKITLVKRKPVHLSKIESLSEFAIKAEFADAMDSICIYKTEKKNQSLMPLPL